MDQLYSTNAVQVLSKIDNFNDNIVLYTQLDHNYQIDDTIFLFVKNQGDIITSASTYNLYTYLDSLYLYNNYDIIGYSIISIDDNKIIINKSYSELLLLINNSSVDLQTELTNNYIFITKILTDQTYFEKTNANINININCTILNNSTFNNNNLFNINIIQAIFINIQNTLYNIEFNNKYDSNYITTNYDLDILNNLEIYNTYNNNEFGYNYYIDLNVDMFSTTGDTNPYITSGIFINTSYLNKNNLLDNLISNVTINNGYFYNYNLYKVTINYAYCKNCFLHSDSINELYTWNNGIWDNLSNSDSNFLYKIWNNGTWLNGLTLFDIIWNNGIFDNGIFTGGTWSTGTFNNGTFDSSLFIDGVFNNGNMTNSTIYNIELNGGSLYNILFNNGTINNGYIGRNSIINYCTFNNGTITDNTTIKYCIANNGIISNSLWYDGLHYNGTFFNSLWNDGIFYDGYFYNGSIFKNGIIYNGKFENSIIQADNLRDITMEFCTIYNSYLEKVVINNGIINNSTKGIITYLINNNDNNYYTYYYYDSGGVVTIHYSDISNCVINYCTFNDGIINNNSLWNDGNFNWGVFDTSSLWYGGNFYDGEFNGVWNGGVFYNGSSITIDGYIMLNASSFNQYNVSNNVDNNIYKNDNLTNTHIDSKGRVRSVKKQYNSDTTFSTKKAQSDLINNQNIAFEQLYLNLQNLNNQVYSGSTST